jgi:hypothetical protein
VRDDVKAGMGGVRHKVRIFFFEAGGISARSLGSEIPIIYSNLSFSFSMCNR